MIFSALKKGWLPALGELVLIVAGILIALAIDARVQQAADREEEAYYLEEIASDLRDDGQRFTDLSESIRDLNASAKALLKVVERGRATDEPVGELLIKSLSGEGMRIPPPTWLELMASGDLSLISERPTRTALVQHFNRRERILDVVDSNFVPAVRDLRALAWDVLPVETFEQYFQQQSVPVSGPELLDRILAREDAEFLIKRVIVTSVVASGSLGELGRTSVALADSIQPEAGLTPSND